MKAPLQVSVGLGSPCEVPGFRQMDLLRYQCQTREAHGQDFSHYTQRSRAFDRKGAPWRTSYVSRNPPKTLPSMREYLSLCTFSIPLQILNPKTFQTPTPSRKHVRLSPRYNKNNMEKSYTTASLAMHSFINLSFFPSSLFVSWLPQPVSFLCSNAGLKTWPPSD